MKVKKIAAGVVAGAALMSAGGGGLHLHPRMTPMTLA